MTLRDRLAMGLKRAVALDIIKYGNPNCPYCGSTSVASIRYGLVHADDVHDQLDSGEITLGGCMISDTGDPAFECNLCYQTFDTDLSWVKFMQLRNQASPYSGRWKKFREHQDWRNVAYCELSAICATTTLEQAVLAGRQIEGETAQDTVINHFFCDWRTGKAVWCWLYRAGDVFTFDENTRCLIRKADYLDTDDYMFDCDEDVVVYIEPNLYEVSAEKFFAYLNEQNLLNQHRRAQVGLAQYTGERTDLRHDKLYEVEVLLDHTFRMPTENGDWRTINLLEETHQTPLNLGKARYPEVLYRNDDWTVSYGEYFAKDAAELGSYSIKGFNMAK